MLFDNSTIFISGTSGLNGRMHKSDKKTDDNGQFQLLSMLMFQIMWTLTSNNSIIYTFF